MVWGIGDVQRSLGVLQPVFEQVSESGGALQAHSL